MITRELKSAKQVLKAATVRDFSGGWNILDADLNLSTKFSRVMKNVAVLADGTVTLRYGVRLFADLRPHYSSPGAYLINMIYFSNAIVAVASNGDVFRILGDTSVTRIWDATIAAALPGSPDGWSTTTFCSFAEFNNDLIICNGIDKPLIVNADHDVDYLQDLATLTNINTPICRYVVSCDRYLVMAGDPVEPYRIHISAKDASGTWFGDPDPNDATFVDVGSILNAASFIRGIGSFRGQLIIGFAEGTIIGRLGEYVEDAHTPTFEDPVEQYGAVAHRSMISYGDDMLMMDRVGVPSLKRTVFTGTLRPERASDYIDQEIKTALDSLNQTSVEDRCFAVYNRNEGQFMFFVPNANSLETTSETRAYVHCYRPSLSIKTWARYDGWNFTCACTSIEGRLFFGCPEGKIWIYGTENDPIYADYLGDPEVNDEEGLDINFEWELPWSDINKRARTKRSKYLAMDTEGDAVFTAKMYVDRYRLDADNLDSPALSTDFVAGDAGGFGVDDAPYGGGRNTAYERNWAWPAKFKMMKLAFTGSTKKKLKFISVTLMYQEGSFYR